MKIECKEEEWIYLRSLITAQGNKNNFCIDGNFPNFEFVVVCANTCKDKLKINVNIDLT